MNDEPLKCASDALLHSLPTAVADPRSYLAVHLVAVPLGVALLAGIVQHTSLDLAIANLFVHRASRRFSWRDCALLDIRGHQAARSLPFLVGAIAFAAGAAGYWIRALVKTMATQHCAVALQSFGGIVDYAADLTGRSGPARRKAPATACRANMPPAATRGSRSISRAGPPAGPTGTGVAWRSASAPDCCSASSA